LHFLILPYYSQPQYIPQSLKYPFNVGHFFIQAVVRSLREKVDSATAEQGEPRILMALTDLPVADLADLYGDQIGKNRFLFCQAIIHGKFVSVCQSFTPYNDSSDPDLVPNGIWIRMGSGS
jgi:hypothetical protein